MKDYGADPAVREFVQRHGGTPRPGPVLRVGDDGRVWAMNVLTLCWEHDGIAIPAEDPRLLAAVAGPTRLIEV